MPYKDKEKQKECSKQWHKEHYNGEYRAARLKNAKDRRKVVKKDFSEYKATLSCSICGENDECCLDFHHIDPLKKDLPLSKALTNNWSMKRLMKEVDKCQVVCSNCHRKIHKKIRYGIGEMESH